METRGGSHHLHGPTTGPDGSNLQRLDGNEEEYLTIYLFIKAIVNYKSILKKCENYLIEIADFKK